MGAELVGFLKLGEHCFGDPCIQLEAAAASPWEM